MNLTADEGAFREALWDSVVTLSRVDSDDRFIETANAPASWGGEHPDDPRLPELVDAYDAPVSLRNSLRNPAEV